MRWLLHASCSLPRVTTTNPCCCGSLMHRFKDSSTKRTSVLDGYVRLQRAVAHAVETSGEAGRAPRQSGRTRTTCMSHDACFVAAAAAAAPHTAVGQSLVLLDVALSLSSVILYIISTYVPNHVRGSENGGGRGRGGCGGGRRSRRRLQPQCLRPSTPPTPQNRRSLPVPLVTNGDNHMSAGCRQAPCDVLGWSTLLLLHTVTV